MPAFMATGFRILIDVQKREMQRGGKMGRWLSGWTLDANPCSVSRRTGQVWLCMSVFSVLEPEIGRYWAPWPTSLTKTLSSWLSESPSLKTVSWRAVEEGTWPHPALVSPCMCTDTCPHSHMHAPHPHTQHTHILVNTMEWEEEKKEEERREKLHFLSQKASRLSKEDL